MWGLDPEDVCMVDDECRADGARTSEAGLIAADGNGEGLCKDWLAILVQFCADDWNASYEHTNAG